MHGTFHVNRHFGHPARLRYRFVPAVGSPAAVGSDGWLARWLPALAGSPAGSTSYRLFPVAATAPDCCAVTPDRFRSHGRSSYGWRPAAGRYDESCVPREPSFRTFGALSEACASLTLSGSCRRDPRKVTGMPVQPRQGIDDRTVQVPALTPAARPRPVSSPADPTRPGPARPTRPTRPRPARPDLDRCQVRPTRPGPTDPTDPARPDLDRESNDAFVTRVTSGSSATKCSYRLALSYWCSTIGP
jgi:hypothetical protein